MLSVVCLGTLHKGFKMCQLRIVIGDGCCCFKGIQSGSKDQFFASSRECLDELDRFSVTVRL